MYRYERFLPALAATARSHYPRQVLDSSRRDHGAYIAEIYGCPAADHPSNAGMLACACAAFMAEGSELEGDDELFDALKTDNRVQAVFVGHEHVNDYIGSLDGVDLCYGRGTGYGAYGKDGFQRGGRVIRISQGVQGYDSYCRLADGSIAERPVHQPGSSECTE